MKRDFVPLVILAIVGLALEIAILFAVNYFNPDLDPKNIAGDLLAYNGYLVLFLAGLYALIRNKK